MECLVCDFKFSKDDNGKKHYIEYHGVNDQNAYFLDLFEPDTLERKRSHYRANFRACRMKKNHMFLYHYDRLRMGGAGQRALGLPLNISKRGQITYYSVNFEQHKDYLDFYSSDMIDVFLDSVRKAFQLQNNLTYKFQGYFEIINQQRGPEFNLTDKRPWLTNVYHFKYFNAFVRVEIKNEMMNRIIVNGQSGSSWFFKRFNRLSIIVTPLFNELKLYVGWIIFLFSELVKK